MNYEVIMICIFTHTHMHTCIYKHRPTRIYDVTLRFTHTHRNIPHPRGHTNNNTLSHTNTLVRAYTDTHTLAHAREKEVMVEMGGKTTR